MKPKFLKLILRSKQKRKNLMALKNFVQYISNDKIPEEIKKYTTAVRLIPLIKSKNENNEITKVRPIGIMSIFYRITAKIVKDMKEKEICEILKKRHWGSSIKNSANKIYKLLDLAIESNKRKKKQKKILAQIDFTNAFNSVSRIALKKVILNQTPFLIKVFQAMYQTNNIAICNSNTMNPIITEIETGVIQGNGLSGVLFDLAVNFFINQSNYVKYNTKIDIYILL